MVAFGIYRPLITLIYILSIAATFYLGIGFGLNSAMLVAFYLYLSKFFNPIQNLADLLNNLQKAFTSVGSVLGQFPDHDAAQIFPGRSGFCGNGSYAVI